VNQSIVGAALTAAIAFAAWSGAAQAQSIPERAQEKGPRTLLELLLGSNGNDKRKVESGEEDRLDPDRPHFPEASTTVGNGRAMLESGYTFTRKGTTFSSHSYPEALLRAGMFADWFELRIGQSFVNQRQTEDGMTTSANGAQDLYLGMKLALTEQKGLLPTMAVIPQTTVPTGSASVTAGKMLPGLNVDCSWEVIKDVFGIEFLVANNRVMDDLGNIHHEVATGLTGAFQLTRQLELFVEWDAFYPVGAIGRLGPRHYAVGGLVYFVTRDFEVDFRSGVGLNGNSNDFLVGVGFAARR
jgi:hypothetical protein